MDTTLILSALWGPILFLIGVGMLGSTRFYLSIYKDLEREPLAVLTFGLFSTAFGILHVLAHNVWTTVPQIIISVLGWGLLLKGAAFIATPRLVNSGAGWAAAKHIVPIAGSFMVLLGAYLSWFAYLA